MRSPRRLVAVLLVALAALLAAAPAALAYGWPVRPFLQQHPIRGFFGDPRTVFDGLFSQDGVDSSGSFSFHNGVDVSAPDGTAVFPVVTGIVHPIDGTALAVKTFDGRTFQYFHVVPAVTDGQLVVAQTTLLGHVQAPYEHVHLSEIDGMRITNPLLPGHLAPYVDGTRPTIGAVVLRDAAGEVSAPAVVCGGVDVAAQAWDMPPLPVPGSFAGMPVAPALVTWQLRTSAGETILPPRVAVDFRRTLPRPRDFWQVYARGSYQNAPRFGSQQFKTMPGRFLYRLATALDTRTLPDGAYVVRVSVADERGNSDTLSRRFWIDNRGGCAPQPQPAPATQPPATPPTQSPPPQSP